MRRIGMTARVVPALAVAVIGTAIVVPRATAHPAAAPSATTDATATSQSVTLLYIDAATGTVTSTWTGNQDEAATLTTAPPDSSGTLTQLSQQSGKISTSTVQKTGCTLPNGYWNVRASSLYCYAYAGSVSTWISYTYQVDAGNNNGWFKYVYGGIYHSISLAKWTSAVFYSKVTVTYIRIY